MGDNPNVIIVNKDNVDTIDTSDAAVFEVHNYITSDGRRVEHQRCITMAPDDCGPGLAVTADRFFGHANADVGVGQMLPFSFEIPDVKTVKEALQVFNKLAMARVSEISSEITKQRLANPGMPFAGIQQARG